MFHTFPHLKLFNHFKIAQCVVETSEEASNEAFDHVEHDSQDENHEDTSNNSDVEHDDIVLRNRSESSSSSSSSDFTSSSSSDSTSNASAISTLPAPRFYDRSTTFDVCLQCATSWHVKHYFLS